MTYSLLLQNGDLNPSGPGGVAIVTGADKLIQDLRCCILEPLGTDPLHLNYGSSLDGGVDPQGQVIPSFIGSMNINDTMIQVEAEIRRIIYNYQQQQAERLAADQQALGGKNTFAPGEILWSLDSVTMTPVGGDTLVVQVGITNSDGQSLNVLVPVST